MGGKRTDEEINAAAAVAMAATLMHFDSFDGGFDRVAATGMETQAGAAIALRRFEIFFASLAYDAA